MLEKLITTPLKFAAGPLRYLPKLSTVGKTAAVLAGGSGLGMIGSQLPGFVSHYVQRLGGHASRAQIAAEKWQEQADLYTNGSIDELITIHRESHQEGIQATGDRILDDTETASYLQSAYEAIRDAPILAKPIEFFKNFDADIAQETWSDYVYNIPMSPEGIIYFTTAFALGAGIVLGGKKLLTKAKVL